MKRELREPYLMSTKIQLTIYRWKYSHLLLACLLSTFTAFFDH